MILSPARLGFYLEVFLSKIDVYLDEKQIDSLKMILDQSQVGIHLLFDNKFISEVFKEDFQEDLFFTVDNLVNAQEDLIRLIKAQTIEQKKDFISKLNRGQQSRLVRAYFYIIENDIKQNQIRPH